jgi:hypothetical protein
VGHQIEVQGAPTSFGKVSYTLARHGSTIDGELELPVGSHARLRLRLPAGLHLLRVTIGSAAVAANRAGTISLGGRAGRIELHATVAR